MEQLLRELPSVRTQIVDREARTTAQSPAWGGWHDAGAPPAHPDDGTELHELDEWLLSDVLWDPFNLARALHAVVPTNNRCWG